MSASKNHGSAPGTQRAAYTIEEFREKVPIGRTGVYELIKEGKLKSIFISGRRLIPASEVERLLAGEVAS